MTDNTQPEALIDLIDAYAETRHRYGRIHNAKTKAARNAVIEALSGVQAAHSEPWYGHQFKEVRRGYWQCSCGKAIAEAVPSAPAASPTPPAEQQAQPGAVYAELPAPTASIGTDDAWHEAAMRDFADRTHAARLRCKSEQARLATLWGYVRADAAPKAAPAQQAGEAAESVPAREHDLQDVRCECCGYMTYHREHMGCIHAARKQ